MQLNKNDAELVLFEDEKLKHGSVVVGAIKGKVIRAIKANFADSRSEDCFVTIGPFADKRPALPKVYEIMALDNETVLDISGSIEFCPSLDPGDILANPPRPREAGGIVFVGEKGTYLNTAPREVEGGLPLWLDVSTGILHEPQPSVKTMATSRWRLVERGGGWHSNCLFEFPESPTSS